MSRTLARWRPFSDLWQPFSDLAELRERLDQAFEGGEGERSWAPRIDVVEGESEIVLKADLPGLTADDVTIEVEEGVLNVSGSRTEEKEEKEERYVRRERRTGSFSRSMRLPKGVEPDDIKATCEHGVLEVTIPMPEEKPAAARVEIKPTAG
jgi:HSP20 family protein